MNEDLEGRLGNRKDVLERSRFIVFEEDGYFEDRISVDEEITASEAKITSSFLSRSFDVVMIMSLI